MSSTVDRVDGEPNGDVEEAEGQVSGAAVVTGEAGDDGGDAEDILVEVVDSDDDEDDENDISGLDPADRQIALLEAQVAELEAKAQDTYDRLVRSAADLDNFRKRSRREVRDARIDEQMRVLREMLPVVDNLERALAASGDAPETASIREGLQLVLRQFLGALDKFGVAKVEAIGKAFDPNLHEAVTQIETGEHSPGSVVQVLQTGYIIGDRLLRAALAVVAAAPAPAPEAAPAPAPDAAPAPAPEAAAPDDETLDEIASGDGNGAAE